MEELTEIVVTFYDMEGEDREEAVKRAELIRCEWWWQSGWRGVLQGMFGRWWLLQCYTRGSPEAVSLKVHRNKIIFLKHV